MSEELKILMLEDDPADAVLVEQELHQASIEFTFLRVDEKKAFITALEEYQPDIILADYRLPDFDGLDALAIARKRVPDVPFVFVSGAMGEEFAIETLHRGAADYVLKHHLSKLAPAVMRTLQEAAERNLRRNLAAIVESSEDAIYSYTLAGNITAWNGGAVKTYGYSAAEIVGKPVALLMTEQGSAECTELLASVGSGQSVLRRETTRRCRDGRLIDVSISLSPIRDPSGAIRGVSSFDRDITELKVAERAMRQLNSDLQDRDERLRTLFQTIPDLIWVKDQHGIYRSCNPPFERLKGLSTKEILGKTDYDLVDREQAHTIRENDRLVLAHGKSMTSEEWVSFPDSGERVLLETIKTPMRDHADRPVGVLAIARDITERHKNEEQLRIAATAFEVEEGMFITDANELILRVNHAFSQITGYIADEVVGRTPRLLESGQHSSDFYVAMRDRIQREGSWQGEIWNRRKNGEVYPEWLNITAVKNKQGAITHYVGAFTDITERKAAEKKIEHLAYFDLLTQLPNRRLLVDRLQQALAGCARSRRMGAILFLDLDNFKIINDTCGHDVGDQLLVEVAKRLSACVRDVDTIARLGGDEFVVMLKDLSENQQEASAQAKNVGEKVLATLRRHYVIEGRVHHSSPSIGATLFGERDVSVDELLKQADIAMYQAKSSGRNALRFFDPDMQAVLTVRADMENAMRLAIRDHQFVLHYQPQVDGSRVVGAEGLIRWNHPQRSMVSPEQFVPLAEETGLILSIGQWVLEEACAQLRDWQHDQRTRHLTLAINVSALQFRQVDFVDQVNRVLEISGAMPSKLKLELTESLILDDVEGTIEKMTALKQLGVGFSMDDFGTGYSSLSYLARLPLDQIKIDQSFVRNLTNDSIDAIMVQTIITMALSLNLDVIAEGVETEAQLQFLKQHGCPVYQGYLYGKPVPLEEFNNLVGRTSNPL